MALSPRRTTAVVNTLVDTMAALANSGYLRIYDGTQPITADTAIGSQVLLAELRWNATAFAAGVLGVATANAITADASANATGTATWFRSLKSDGTTVIWDGSVGTSGCDLNINTVAIVAASNVAVTAYTLTESKT